MVQIGISSLLSWFSGLAGKFFTDNLLKFTSYKILIFTLLTVTLPVVIKNLMTWFFEQIISVAQNNADFSELSSIVVEFSGFAGYLASHLLIPDCVSVLLTAVAIRAMLNFIPFVG